MKPNRIFGILVVFACVAVVIGVGVGFGSHQGHSNAGLSNSELADRLGDQDDMFAGTTVTCTTQSGKTLDGHKYNRMCDYSRYVGLCSTGTGEVRKTLYVRVRGATFRVVERDSVGGYVPCASVA